MRLPVIGRRTTYQSGWTDYVTILTNPSAVRRLEIFVREKVDFKSKNVPPGHPSVTLTPRAARVSPV